MGRHILQEKLKMTKEIGHCEGDYIIHFSEHLLIFSGSGRLLFMNGGFLSGDSIVYLGWELV